MNHLDVHIKEQRTQTPKPIDILCASKGCFVLNIEVARQRQDRLALDLVAEDHDRRQIVADPRLMDPGDGSAERHGGIHPMLISAPMSPGTTMFIATHRHDD